MLTQVMRRSMKTEISSMWNVDMKKDTGPGEKIQKMLPLIYMTPVDTLATTAGILLGAMAMAMDMDTAITVLIGIGDGVIPTGELAGAGEATIIPGIMDTMEDITVVIMADTMDMAMLPVIIAEEEIQIIIPEDPLTIGIIPESQTEAPMPDLKYPEGLPELIIEIVVLDDQDRYEIPDRIVE
jgi:hypothetical protein